MIDTGGTVQYQTNDGLDREYTMFTYDETEQEQNKINSANAKLVFQPKFIPVYPSMLDKVSMTEALLFGFIDFYMSNNKNTRFYFTNAQLGEILNVAPDTISRSMIKLEKSGYIQTSKKIRSGGGLIRFVTGCNSYTLTDNISVPKPTKSRLHINNNKINNNKINNKRKIIKEKSEFIEKIQPIIKIKEAEGYKPVDLAAAAELCWLYYQEKGGMKIATTTYNNWLNRSAERGSLKKPKTKQYATLNDKIS